MYTPEAGEYILDDFPISMAFHRLVIGSHHSLLVTNRDGQIVGILRLTDVFALVCSAIEGCD